MPCFSPWDDPDGALKNRLEQKDDLHAGRKVREVPRFALCATGSIQSDRQPLLTRDWLRFGPAS